MAEQPDFEVGIIGGRPAGASMAAYLAKAAVECVVFERELFPRPHVGESLVPASTRVLDELGFLPTMEEAGFPHKYGAAWTSESPASQFRTAQGGLRVNSHGLGILRFEEREQAGVNQDYTYHVDRAKFDDLLLRHAHGLGAQVYQGISVKGADFSDPNMVRIRYGLGRRDATATCRMLVDASGRRTLIGNQMKWRVKDPVFEQYAIHAWFDGYDRRMWSQDERTKDYIFIHFLPASNTWLWQIPIDQSVTSVGVVTHRSNFARAKESRERFFWDTVSSRPELLEGLRAASRIRPFKDEGDYSYAMRQITGDRLVLVGDASRFVDPIFSTGVSIALNSSRFASADVLRALDTGDLSKDAFATYETTVRRGTNNWYKFIALYYRLNVLFTAFVQHPDYRLDVLKLLQGDVYDEEEPAVLERMRRIVSEVERNPDHLWHDLLGSLTANVFAEAF